MLSTLQATKPAHTPASSPHDAHAWSLLDLLAVAVLALVATVPRTANLLGLDPFVDEASWTDWALRLLEPGSPRTWLIPVLTDGRPPLFVWTIAPFGALVDNGIVAGRLAASLAGVLSTVALYGLGREIASRTLGLCAALLWALSPFTVFFSRIAADDPLLTLLAILTAWASVRLARQPTTTTGALCGVALALAVLAKTVGVLLAVAPPLAILMLGRPREWQRYLRPLGAAFAAGLLVSSPLFLGIAPMLQQVSLHTGSSRTDGAGLLADNLAVTAGWLETFAGWRFLALTGLGLILTLVVRQWALLYVALLGAVVELALLDVTTPLFARYLLFGSFPFYLLAAYPVERVAALAARPPRSWPLRPVIPAALRYAAATLVLLAGLVVALGERAELAVGVVLAPATARIPGSEHVGYVENWYATYGLGQVVGELRARAKTGPVTVLVPPASREVRVMVPYGLLRMYLRRDPAIRVVEAPSLWRAQDLREVERLARGGPTYLVVNGSYTPGSGMPNDVAAYTRQLERRLEQDVPKAREVLRIPRPSAPNWLSLYRLDGGE
ncbi:MAG: glycosyltransferase family 39 protein [Chloroflexota bacterium]